MGKIADFFLGKPEKAMQERSVPSAFYQQDASGNHFYTLKQPDSWAMVGSSLLRSDANLIELAHSIPEIYSPIHAIAFRIANADIQLRKSATDEIVYDNREWNRLYSQPNPLQHFKELFYEAIFYKYVTGNNYLYGNVPEPLQRDIKNINTLWNLPAEHVSPKTKKEIRLFSATKLDEIIEGYLLSDGSNSKTFTPGEILYIKALNLQWSDRKLKGKSPLLSADKAIANLIAVYEARNVIFTKRGALGAIVSRKSDASGTVALTNTEKKNMRDDLNSTYGVTGGKDTYAVTDQPVDFIRFGMSIQELQPFDETLADAAAIYGALNVPFELAPKMKGETFDNQIGAKKSLYTNVCIPEANMWMQSLTNFLQLEKQGLYLYADFSKVDELQENLKEKSEVFAKNVESYTTLYEKGAITKNAFLIGCGFEALDANGDLYVTDEKNDTPLAVRLGVGGTQALQSILADTNLSEEQKKNTLMILFGIPEADAKVMSVGKPIKTPSNAPQD